MIYVLDTDILTLLGYEDSPEAPRIRRRIAQLPSDHLVVTTIINFEEQMRGWMAALTRVKSRRSEVPIYNRLLQHLATFRHMTILPYDAIAEENVEQLQAQRLQIGTMDLKIAAIVLASDATLITRNVRDFRKVPTLRTVDWSADED